MPPTTADLVGLKVGADFIGRGLEVLLVPNRLIGTERADHDRWW
jgi:hypothetical protein